MDEEAVLAASDDAPSIPTPLFSDYVEMTYLTFVLVVGLPINIHVLFKLLQQSRRSACYSVKRGFLLLKINLNISDILILLINAGGKLGWLVTYEWVAGQYMCQLFKFLSIGTLYLSSNIVVCIAVDRLKTVMTAQRVRHEQNIHMTKVVLMTAWVLALISSVPQLFVFRAFDVLYYSSESWYQCTDIWSVEAELVHAGIHNRSIAFPFNDSTKNLHELSHLFIVFYGPLIVMAVCYFIIAVKLIKYSKGNMQSGGSTSSARSQQFVNERASIMTCNFSEYDKGVDTSRSFTPPLKASGRLLRVLQHEFGYCLCVSSGEKRAHIEHHPSISRKKLLAVSSKSGAGLTTTDQTEPESSALFTWTPVVTRKLTVGSEVALDFDECRHAQRRLSSDILRKFTPFKSHKQSTKSLTASSSDPVSARLSGNRQPAWRRQLRSRVFKTTLLVVLTHVIFWLPYNFISLLRFVSEDLHTRMRNHMNVFEDMQFLIALVNPFLYGFGESLSRY